VGAHDSRQQQQAVIVFFIIFARYSMPTIFSFAMSSMAAMYLASGKKNE
jgi:hypothetical protein